MKYEKPPLSFEDQADLVISRGLVAHKDELIARLQSVNYYRLSAYWYTFRIADDPDDQLQPGTSLDTVWRRYRFDRQLRLLAMDAIERVEIGIRTEANYSHEEFVRHYLGKYTKETDLPLWMACELLTFGGMLTLFNGLPTRMKKDVARDFGLNVPILGSWLRAIKQVRNICARHSRLWNREFGIRPMMPFKETFPDWHDPVVITDERLFGILTVLHFLLKQVAPQSHWRQRLAALFAEYNDIPLRFMGFPDNWEDSPLWH